MTSRRVGRFLSIALLAVVVPTSSAGADGDWNFVYGSSPTDYSRYQVVELEPNGGAYLSGFFSGNFEGLSSPGSYTQFLQYRTPAGTASWTTALVSTGASIPGAMKLVTNASGEALVSDASHRWVFGRSGTLRASAAGPGEAASQVVVSGDSFIRVVNGCELESFTPDLATNWKKSLAPLCTSNMEVATDTAGGVWAAFEIPKVLPTDLPSLGLVRVDQSGQQIVSIRHFGRSLGGGFIAVNKDFLWLRSIDYATDLPPPAPPGQVELKNTTAFRTDNGAVIGNVRCTPYDSSVCVSEWFQQIPLMGYPNISVVSGGRRLVIHETNLNLCGCVMIYDLVGVSQVSMTRVKVISLQNSAGVSNIIFDADDFGNLVVAGSTSDSVVFTAAAASLELSAAASVPHAFVTRNPGGRVPLKLSPSVPLEVKVAGVNGVPFSGVAAVSLNVTATSPDGDGYVTVYPCGSRPDASNVNYVAGQTVPNAVIAPVSPSGTICFYSYATTHLIADVNGYFPTGNGFIASPPVRVLDTRPGAGDGLRVVDKAKIGGAVELKVKLTDLPGYVPAAGVGAVSLNVTVTAPDDGGYVTVYPCGDRPNASSLNYVAGQTVPNAVIAPVSPSGEVCFYSSSTTHLIADVNGYFPTDGGFVALAPVRRFDTR